jgi:hypothetical protein
MVVHDVPTGMTQVGLPFPLRGSRMWYLYGFAMLAGLANAGWIAFASPASMAKPYRYHMREPRRGKGNPTWVIPQPFFAGLVVVVVSGSALLVAGLVTGRLSLPSHEQFAKVEFGPGWIAFASPASMAKPYRYHMREPRRGGDNRWHVEVFARAPAAS